MLGGGNCQCLNGYKEGQTKYIEDLDSRGTLNCCHFCYGEQHGAYTYTDGSNIDYNDFQYDCGELSKFAYFF